MSHGQTIDPREPPKISGDYRRPTTPRWLQIIKSEPGRWIEHLPPLDSHTAGIHCTVCVYNPALVSWEMFESLQDEAEAQSRAREELQARLGQGGAESFDQVRQERDELIEQLDEAWDTIRGLDARIKSFTFHQQASAAGQQARTLQQPGKKGWFR